MNHIILVITLLMGINSSLNAACRPQETTLTSPLDGFKVHILDYRLEKAHKHIILIPPTGGTNFIDRSWAKNFCQAGFNTRILEHWTDDDEYNLDLGIHQRFYSRAQKAIGIVINDIPENEFVGIIGTSVGGIHSAMAMGLHDRLNAAFVITAGADLPGIIADSDQKAMVTAWEKRQSLYNIPDKATYKKLLDQEILYDPLKLPKKFHGKKLGMLLATGDTTVPYVNQKKLQELWNPGTVIEYPHNHFWAIVLSWIWDSKKVIQFFNESAKT